MNMYSQAKRTSSVTFRPTARSLRPFDACLTLTAELRCASIQADGVWDRGHWVHYLLCLRDLPRGTTTRTPTCEIIRGVASNKKLVRSQKRRARVPSKSCP